MKKTGKFSLKICYDELCNIRLTSIAGFSLISRPHVNVYFCFLLDMFFILSTIVLIALITYASVKPLIYNLFYSVPHEPPYVHSYVPVIGFALQLFKDPVEFIRSLYLKYGKMFVIVLGSRRCVYLYDEQTYLTKVLKSPNLSMEEFTADFMVNAFGVSRQWLSIEDIQQIQTKQYHQYLSGDQLAILNKRAHDSLMESMKYDAKKVQSNSRKVVMNFFDLFGEFIMYAGCDGLFGRTFTNEQRHATPNFYDLYESFDQAVNLSILRKPFRTILNKSTFEKRREFVKRFYWLKLNNDESDIVRVRDELFRSAEYKHLFPDDDIAVLHAALLWVAVANTIPTCCWSIVDLLLHPEAFYAVKEELKENLSSSSSTASIYEKETLSKLTILESCINESMRRTSYTFSTRQAKTDTTIECLDKTKIGLRKGDMLIYPAFLRHTDPDLFGPHPYQYQYDRFVKRPNQPKVPSVMLFGCGAHTCPGRYWAINMIKMLVALIVQHMDIEFVNMTEQDKNEFRTRLPYDYSKLVVLAGPRKGYKHKFDIKYSYKNVNMG